jgi:glucosamine-6-phosphate deaminase
MDVEVPMKVIITKDYDHLSQVSADIVVKLVNNKPNLAFCTPAGGSPIGMYKVLIEQSEKKEVDFSKMRVCNMDEYVGLKPTHDQSYNYFVRHHFLNHVPYDKKNSVFIDGLASDTTQECKRYNKALDTLNLDLAISGIGANGHIAFNEPAKYLSSRTHVADLYEDTILANSRFFDNVSEVPKQAYSIGIADLMMASTLMIVASGKNKANVVAELFKDNLLSTQFPVSLIKMHPNCVIILDQDAFSLCTQEQLTNLQVQLEIARLDR